VSTAAVYLAWGPLGAAPLRSFLDSYAANPAGSEHELVILFNGVDDSLRGVLLEQLAGVEHSLLELREPVQDLAAYAQAAAGLGHDRLCFLNSYSVVLAANWLAMLESGLDGPGVGLVGASGSWASLRSLALAMHFLPSPYRGALPERAIVLAEFPGPGVAGELQSQAERPSGRRRSLAGAALSTLRALPEISAQVVRFPGFPNHHVRSTAFLIERDVFAGLRASRPLRKLDAYALESGHRSITRQVEATGRRVLVVDSRGEQYEQHSWAESQTFWQGSQERLLIADKQTALYADGGFDRRRLLSAMAWGPRASPARPI
jgi:hypothetical protein